MRDKAGPLLVLYVLAAGVTFMFLTFLKGPVDTAEEFALAIPLNALIALVWPVYWGLLHWL